MAGGARQVSRTAPRMRCMRYADATGLELVLKLWQLEKDGYSIGNRLHCIAELNCYGCEYARWSCRWSEESTQRERGQRILGGRRPLPHGYTATGTQRAPTQARMERQVSCY